MLDSIIIARALQQLPRLTLPNLGTLLKKTDGEIVFSQFLRNDDKVLASIVMNSYQIGAEEAGQMVNELVADMMTKISTSGEYILPELGYLTSDSSGAIKFKKGIPPQKPEPVIVNQRPQIEPQPIVGIPQQQPIPQQPIPQQRQFRQQPPYGPRPQQVIPQRRPQQAPQRRPQQNAQQGYQQTPYQQMPGGRPVAPRRKHKPAKKTDYWLIIAILCAIIVLILILYSLFFTDTISDFM